MQCLRTGGVAVLLASVALLTGCSASGHVRPTTPRALASEQARTMLAAAIVPRGSQELATSALAPLDKPAVTSSCSPLIDVAKGFLIRQTTPDQVSAFIAAHPTPHMSFSGTGYFDNSDGTPGSEVSEWKAGETPRRSTLVFTIAAAGNGTVIVRVDAQVIPAGSRCVNNGTVPAG